LEAFMRSRQLIEKICFPTVVVSSLASVVLYIVVIWSEPFLRAPLLTKLATTTLILALGSGFVLSATRVTEGRRRSDG
jgi:hypothetical protein